MSARNGMPVMGAHIRDLQADNQLIVDWLGDVAVYVFFSTPLR